MTEKANHSGTPKNRESKAIELSGNKILVQQECETAKQGQNTEYEMSWMIARLFAIVEGSGSPRVFGAILLFAGIYKKKQCIKASQENKFHKVTE